MQATLERFAYTPVGTFGRLRIGGKLFYTVEDPDAGNAVGRSCIPEGVYQCHPRPYYKGGYDAYEVRDVPGRSYILLHVANTHHDVEGCIGIGKGLGYVKNTWAVTESRDAFDSFMQIAGGEPFTLTISQYQPTKEVAG